MKFFEKNETNISLYDSKKSLTEIANKLETDKGTADKESLSWGLKWPDHFSMGYTLTYEKYMREYRDKKTKLFEIGICDQRFPYASSKMWKTYFQDLDLYCVDNFWGKSLDEKLDDVEMLNIIGINFIHADQGNFLDWGEIKRVCPNDFDFFVEDGSHWPNHMVISLWQSIDMVRSGGYYFMEDLQNPLTSRGKYRYDNSLLSEELLVSLTTKEFNSVFLNEKQNQEVNDSYELVELVLDKMRYSYLAVFRKK
jgi:hypothetical protein